MVIYPENSTIEDKNKNSNTILCYAYDHDLIQVYDFYCARYENITYEEFLNKGISEVQRKLASIPENEPLFNILKSRVINPKTIKNKDEQNYWIKLKKDNKIPDIYLPNQEIEAELKSKVGGIKDGKRFM